MNELRVKNINVGDRVRHITFGEGLVTKSESAPGDVVVTITFNNSGSKRLLLNYAPMEIIEKYKAPPEKIVDGFIERTGATPCEAGEDPRNGAQRVAAQRAKEHKAYTTEFKIKVVEQALSEGRAVVRKHYGLPETTLRSWIKQFNTGGRETL